MANLTMRDQFASNLLPAIYRDFWEDCRHPARGQSVPEDWRENLVLEAYQFADLMIALRELPPCQRKD